MKNDLEPRSERTEGLEKVLKGFTKNTGDRPYAFFCNKKTFKKIEKEMRATLYKPHTLHDPHALYKLDETGYLSMCFGGIPVYESEGCPDDKIYALDEKTTLKIRAYKFPWEKKGG